MPRKNGHSLIFTKDEQEIINKLSSGPQPRGEFLPKEDGASHSELFRLSGIIDLLVEKGVIWKAFGSCDTFYYLTSQESELVRNGVLSRNERAIPDLFDLLNPTAQEQFIQRIIGKEISG
jgi:hypothetical protein